MDDNEKVEIENNAIKEIDLKLKPYTECYIMFYDHFGGKDEIKLWMRDEVNEYNFFVDKTKEGYDAVYNTFLFTGSVIDEFIQALMNKNTYDILIDGYKVEKDVSIDGYIYNCHEVVNVPKVEMANMIETTLINTLRYYILKHVIDYINKRLALVIKHFRDDYEASIKLMPKKRKRGGRIRYTKEGNILYKKTKTERYYDKFFGLKYGVSYFEAADIYSNLDNPLELRLVLGDIIKKRKQKVKEIPEDMLKKAALVRGVSKKYDYCSEDWIKNEVNYEKITLKNLNYNDIFIRSFIVKYEEDLRKECKEYKKMLKEEEEKKAAERVKKFRIK